MNKIIENILLRAAHTFWQTFLGSIAAWWAGSGLDLAKQVTTVSGAERFGSAALAAAIACALSAAKTTLKAYNSDPTKKDNPAEVAAALAALDAPLP